MTRTLSEKAYRCCTRKRKFFTKEESINTGRKYKMRTYKCKYCVGYHLTRVKPLLKPMKEEDYAFSN